mgnify:FL=1
MLFCSVSSLQAQQNDCKVLLESISGTYTGKCKKGLAHGKGSAQGIDYYEGTFSKGLPSGKGLYRWSDGSYYDGEWKDGKKDGRGKLVRDGSEISGFWKNDEYIGKEIIPPYKVTRSLNLARSTFKRSGAIEGVRILFLQAGSENVAIENLSIASSSGSDYRSGKMYGIQNVFFPLDVKIQYFTWNKMRTGKVEVIFEFTINEPGAWEVTLNN